MGKESRIDSNIKHLILSNNWDFMGFEEGRNLLELVPNRTQRKVFEIYE